MVGSHHPTIRGSRLYRRRGDKVECSLCERRCLVSPGESGRCGTRMNLEGGMYTLVYGDLSALESRPIEMKPLYHYHPGTTALTFSTWSCNLDCPWCQNHHLSKRVPLPGRGEHFAPGKVLEEANRRGDRGLCASFQEPTLLADWIADLFSLGGDLYRCLVTNGYMTPEALGMLVDSGMDAMSVDVKGDADTYRDHCGGAEVEVVWRNIRLAREGGVHLEVVNLIVPGVNDREETIQRVIDRHLECAGEKAPLHFSKYHPAYLFREPPTDPEILRGARRMAKEAGVEFVYLGNLPGRDEQATFCPSCGARVIDRAGRVRVYLEEGRCPSCGLLIEVRSCRSS
ncbi:MAG: radical SAM protein [Methanomassiliicoccales archaeon]